MERDATARDVWLALETQFLGNRETRALHLDYQFRNFVQGELSITDYCCRFKTMADGLAALGESVSDRTLVLNVIRGLNDRFSDIDRHLRRGRPSPLFKDVVSELTLKEMTMAHKAAAPPTALLAATARPSSTTPSSGGGRSSDQRPPSGGGSGSGGASSKSKQRRGKQHGGKSSGNPPTTGGNHSFRDGKGRRLGCFHRTLAFAAQPVGRVHSDVARPTASAGPPARSRRPAAAAGAAGPGAR